MDANLVALMEGASNSTTVILPNKGNARDQTINIITAVVIIVVVSILVAVVTVLIHKKLHKQRLRQEKAKAAAGMSRAQYDV
jgi:heme/copper-type cytochrome/quinol oxidase subunit 2